MLQSTSNQSLICAHYSSVSLSGSMDSSSNWFRVRGFLYASPPLHRQTTVHQTLEQMQVAVRHPGVLPLQWISFSISAGADSVLVATVRGSRMPWWSSSQPWLVGYIVGGDSRSAAFYVATCKWHLLMFSTNASVPGGRGQSLTDVAPPFPFLNATSWPCIRSWMCTALLLCHVPHIWTKWPELALISYQPSHHQL